MIFLHSSFRTSSTWMWAQFRKLEGVTAYYEVFNEVLASIDRSQVSQYSQRSWYSKHPPGASYFLEYLPLISDHGGVSGFSEAMAFASFIPQGGIHGNICEAEQRYLADLTGHASDLGKVPVLSCTRSLGRLRGVKSACPGFHILIFRNLFRQWCSYTEQFARGNRGFFETVKLSIENSGHDKFCNYLKDAFPLDKPEIGSANYFCAFVLLHVYLYGQVSDAADMIFDVEKAISDEEYRLAAAQEIRRETGLLPDLSGIKPSIGFSFLDGSQSAEIRERIRVMSDVALSLAPSSSGREFAAKALAGLMEEWEKYDFYAGALSAFAGPRGLLGELERREAKRVAKKKRRWRALAWLRTLLVPFRQPLVPASLAALSLEGAKPEIRCVTGTSS